MAAQCMVGQGGRQSGVSCETDRCRFIGRGGTPAEPAALLAAGPLSNTAGSVLDPVVALRRTISLEPNETAVIALILGMTESRESAIALVEKYQNFRMTDRAFDLAWTHSQVTLRHIDATEGEAQLYGRMAGALIFADSAQRASAGVLRSNRRGKAGFGATASRATRPLSCFA